MESGIKDAFVRCGKRCNFADITGLFSFSLGGSMRSLLVLFSLLMQHATAMAQTADEADSSTVVLGLSRPIW